VGSAYNIHRHRDLVPVGHNRCQGLRPGRVRSAQPIRDAGGELPKIKLRYAIEFINDNLGRNISLAEIAANVEMSPFHFARMFKRSMGLAPHQYVLEQRIDRAKTLLSETALSLTEIAYRLGFASQSHFTAVFRRLTSTTPEAYRKHR
jgi:AraC family transcriptional regulator